LGIEILTETNAFELITKDNEVTGVKAKIKTGELIVNAKSVVLTTGSFGANKKMLYDNDKEIDDKIVAARKKVEAKAAALEKDAARLSKADIQKRQDEINKLAASEDASLQKLMQEQDKKVAEFQAQNEKRQAEERGKLLDSIQTATNNYAKANGYSYVLDANSVVFAVEGKDISDAVLKTLPATQKTEEKK